MWMDCFCWETRCLLSILVFFFFFWSFVEEDFKKLRILEKLKFFASELYEVIGLKWNRKIWLKCWIWTKHVFIRRLFIVNSLFVWFFKKESIRRNDMFRINRKIWLKYLIYLINCFYCKIFDFTFVFFWFFTKKNLKNWILET